MRKVCWILFIGLLQSTACKEHCPPCSKIPDDAQSLIGDWEWSYSVMASELPSSSGQFIAYDTITPVSTGSVVLVEVSRDGCHRFWIDSEEYCSCVKILKSNRFFSQNNNFCEDVIEVEFNGLDLCYEGFLTVEGLPDCVLDTIVGRHFPFNEDRQFLPTPELTTGYQVVGFSNFFVRKQ